MEDKPFREEVEIVEETFVTNWFAWVHLQSLIAFRSSGQTMDAGNWWLDKEIAEMKLELGIEEVEKHDESSTIEAAHQFLATDASCRSGNVELVR